MSGIGRRTFLKGASIARLRRRGRCNRIMHARNSPETLFDAAKERSLAALGEELRVAEASDPEDLRYPRFKRSDDATALLLRISQGVNQ